MENKTIKELKEIINPKAPVYQNVDDIPGYHEAKIELAKREAEQREADNYEWDESKYIRLVSHAKKSRSLEQRLNDLEQHVISKLDLILQRLEKLEKDGLYYKDKSGSMRPITTEELYEFYNRSGREL